MRLSFEQVRQSADRSFHLLLTPGLNDQYYWHFHPEWEIVWVEGVTGTRHIGDHISRYEGSDLVLIASNVPHLNFDYGVSTDCRQVVIQLPPDFVEMDFFALPEMAHTRAIFQDNPGALAFTGETRARAGALLREIPALPPFEQLMQLMHVLRLLGKSTDIERIDAMPVRNADDKRAHERLRVLHRHVEEHFREPPDSHSAAAKVNLSTAAFCRYFKKASGLTFTDFVNKFRIEQARKQLLMDRTVTETAFDCGFSNLSHFNRTFRRFTGENPSTFRKRHFRA